ncbi:hypothetical protein LguiA_028248 [Lonicera macranthoides]
MAFPSHRSTGGGYTGGTKFSRDNKVDPVNKGEEIKQKNRMDTDVDFQSHANPLFTGIKNTQLNGCDKESTTVIAGTKLVCRTWGNMASNSNWDCDDVMEMGQEDGSKLLENCLSLYEMASGQKINFSKSSILFSTNTNSEIQQNICGLLGVERTTNHGEYLGAPSLIGRNKKEVFSYVKVKAWRRMFGWRNKNLSRAGKEVLIKSVIQAIPSYIMSVFLLSVNLCDELERMMNNFWWGKKKSGFNNFRWRCWDKLCQKKVHGGLGFRKIHNFNRAMLAKQAWRLISSPTSLCGKIFKACYYPHSDFLKAKLGNNPSYIWRSILSS